MDDEEEEEEGTLRWCMSSRWVVSGGDIAVAAVGFVFHFLLLLVPSIVSRRGCPV